MIRIHRHNLDSIASRHYNEFFVEGGYFAKLENRINQTPPGRENAFYQFFYDHIERVITGDPLRLHSLIVELQDEHHLMMKRIAAYQSLKKKHKTMEKRYKRIRKSVDEARKAGVVPQELSDQVDKLKRVFTCLDTARKQISLLIDHLNEVFNYDAFCREYGVTPDTHNKRWGAYLLVQELKQSTCPYCNRHYITVAEPIRREGGRTRPELDHFYSQSKYPFLAVSFYNLIPCCHVCNSNLKRDKEFSIDTHLHPYMQGFDDTVQFTVKFRDCKKTADFMRIFRGDVDLISIDFKVNPLDKRTMPRDEFKSFIKRVNNNKRTFKLKTLYDAHRDIVGEMILKSVLYNDHKIQQLHEDFPKLFPVKEDVTRLLFANYVESDNLDRRVLAKLTRDITKEFGINHT